MKINTYITLIWISNKCYEFVFTRIQKMNNIFEEDHDYDEN